MLREIGLRSLAGPFRKPPNPWLAALGYFIFGALAGAISLPVDANEATWRQTTSMIPPGRPILVYCQSDRCKFAERVSARLINDGFSPISIYRGGWSDWATARSQMETKADSSQAQ